MSIINDVLKQVEQRKKQAESLTLPYSKQSIEDKPIDIKKYVFRFGYVLIMVNLVVASGLFFYRGHHLPEVVDAVKELEQDVISKLPKLSEKKTAINSSAEVIVENSKQLKSASIAEQSQPQKAEKGPAINMVKQISEPKQAASSGEEKGSAGRQQTLMLDEQVQAQIGQNAEQKVQFVKKYKPLSPRQKSQQIYNQALTFLDEGDFYSAEQALQLIIKQNPKFIKASQTLAEILLEQNKSKQAQVIISQGLQRFAQDLKLLELQAKLLLSQQRVTKALALLKKNAPADISIAPDFYNLMAVAYEKLNQIDKAGEIYQQLVYINPHKSAYWFGFALYLENRQQRNEAVNAFVHATESYDATPLIVAYAKDRITALRGVKTI